MSDLTSILGAERITKPSVKLVVSIGYDRFIVTPEDATTLLKLSTRMTRVSRPDYDYSKEAIPQLEITGDQAPLHVSVENAVVVPYGTWELRREQGDNLSADEIKRRALKASLVEAAE